MTCLWAGSVFVGFVSKYSAKVVSITCVNIWFSPIGYARWYLPAPVNVDRYEGHSHQHNNKKGYRCVPYLALLELHLLIFFSTYTNASYPRLWHHCSPPNIANQNKSVVCAERQVASLSEVDLLSLASLYHGKLERTSRYISQVTIAVAHTHRN
jgi:hypothetical protein